MATNNRLRRLSFLLVATCVVLAGKSFAADARPNVVVIVGDDMGYADIGVQGCRDIPTPHIDSIASAGVRCTSGYVSAPYCSPSRAGLITGRYQTHFGYEFNPVGKDTGLPLNESTIADRFKAAGYETAWVGKWHLGGAPPRLPGRRGFEHCFGFLGGSHGYFPGAKPLILRDNKPIHEKEYLTDAFGREAVSFIKQHADKPFFLYLAFNAVHTPMNATDDRLAKFANVDSKKRRKYDAMMLAMDEEVGHVLDTLHEKKLEKNTLVFFISDNGGPTMPGTTINASNNSPLRGSKRTTLEGGIRVPFMVKWPGHLSAGKVYSLPVIQLDILPTALAAAHIKLPSDAKVDGVDLLPYFNGERKDEPHSTLCWRFGEQMAIRRDDWKLVRYDPVMDGLKGEATPPKLYNLANDIGEKNNLIKSEPQKAKELQTAWDEWNQLNIPPLWGRHGNGAKKRNKATGKLSQAEIEREAQSIEAAE
ncbi:MAG TPA: sulfatase [Lacipirellulaceae bacterium]|nr:sulfatase [Lacipirellulaceae bacterium]